MSNATQTVIGPIVSLRRYPLKSMAGEELNLARVAARGLVGDRAYALVDNSTGKVASAKNPRKWSTLFDYLAAFMEPLGTGDDTPPVRITLPNGETVSRQQSTVNKIFSSALGREVTLMPSAPDSSSLEEYWPDIDGLPNRETVTDESMALGAPPFMPRSSAAALSGVVTQLWSNRETKSKCCSGPPRTLIERVMHGPNRQ